MSVLGRLEVEAEMINYDEEDDENQQQKEKKILKYQATRMRKQMMITRWLKVIAYLTNYVKVPE